MSSKFGESLPRLSSCWVCAKWFLKPEEITEAYNSFPYSIPVKQRKESDWRWWYPNPNKRTSLLNRTLTYISLGASEIQSVARKKISSAASGEMIYYLKCVSGISWHVTFWSWFYFCFPPRGRAEIPRAVNGEISCHQIVASGRSTLVSASTDPAQALMQMSLCFYFLCLNFVSLIFWFSFIWEGNGEWAVIVFNSVLVGVEVISWLLFLGIINFPAPVMSVLIFRICLDFLKFEFKNFSNTLRK